VHHPLQIWLVNKAQVPWSVAPWPSGCRVAHNAPLYSTD